MNPDTGRLYPSWHAEQVTTPDPAQAKARKQAQKRRKMAKASRQANRS